MSDDPDYEPTKRKVLIARIRNWSPEETYAFLTIWKKNHKLIKLVDNDEPDRTILQRFIGKALRYGGSERTDREISIKIKHMIKSFRMEEETSLKNGQPSTWKYFNDMKEILELENSLKSNVSGESGSNATYIPQIVLSEDQVQSLMSDSDARTEEDNRRKNFTAYEKQLVMDLVRQNLGIIESKRLDSNTINLKRAAWEDILEQYNSTPGVLQRTTNQLVNLYKNIKKRVPEKRPLEVTDDATDGDEEIMGTVPARPSRRRLPSEQLSARRLQLQEEMHRLEVKHKKQEHALKMRLIQAQLQLVEALKEKLGHASCTIKFPSEKSVVIE